MSRYGPAGGDPDQPDEAQPEQPWEAPTQPQRYGGEPTAPSGGQEYAPPSDPWGHGPDAWTDLTTPQPGHAGTPDPRTPTEPYRPAYGQGHPHQHTQPLPPYPQPQPYAQPYAPPHQPAYGSDVVGWDDPPPRRRTGLVVAVVLLLALAVAGGVAATLVWIGAGDVGGDLQVTGTGTPDPDPSGTGRPDDPEVPEDRIGFGATFALVDDCLVNDAAGDADPRMRILPCDSDEDGPFYRVLERFNEQVSGQSPQEQDESAQQICAEVDGYQVFYRFVGESEDQSFVLCMVVEE